MMDYDKLKIKLEILSDAAKYDASCASGTAGKRKASAQDKKGIGSLTGGTGICHSFTPDGRCISLLKILMTNNCIYDCHYCINRISSDIRRARFTVQEVVDLTLNFYKRNYIEGLFLSSGIIKSPDYTYEGKDPGLILILDHTGKNDLSHWSFQRSYRLTLSLFYD